MEDHQMAWPHSERTSTLADEMNESKCVHKKMTSGLKPRLNVKSCETSGFQGYFALNNDVVLVLPFFRLLVSHLPAVLPLALLSPSRKQAIHCQIASLA